MIHADGVGVCADGGLFIAGVSGANEILIDGGRYVSVLLSRCL